MSDRSDYRLVNDPNTDEEKEQTNVQPPSTSNALDGFQDLDLMSTNVDAAAQEEKRAAQEKRKQERAERKRKSEAADAEDENPYKKFATNPEGYNEWTMEEKRLWNIQRNKAFDATFDDTKNMMKKSRKTRRKKLDVGIKTGPIRKSGRETKQPELFGVSRDTEGAEDVGITWFDKDDNDDWADGSDSGDNTDEEEDEYEYEPEELTLKPKTAQKAGKKEKKITYKEWVTEIEGLDIDDWMEIDQNGDIIGKQQQRKARVPKPYQAVETKGRVTHKFNDLPPKLVAILKPVIQRYLAGGRKDGYKHVTPFTSHGQTNGWGAQRKPTPKGRQIRIGTFDDKDVAAHAVAATFVDDTLLQQSLNATVWINEMVANEESLNSWIQTHQEELDQAVTNQPIVHAPQVQELDDDDDIGLLPMPDLPPVPNLSQLGPLAPVPNLPANLPPVPESAPLEPLAPMEPLAPLFPTPILQESNTIEDFGFTPTTTGMLESFFQNVNTPSSPSGEVDPFSFLRNLDDNL
jgi:hypothetical protein